MDDIISLVLNKLEKHENLFVYSLPSNKSHEYHDIIKSNKEYGYNKYYGAGPIFGEQFYIMREDKVIHIGNIREINIFLIRYEKGAER